MLTVNPELQPSLDATVDQAVNTLRELESDFPESSIEGNLNYIITKVLTEIYTSGEYDDLNDAIGMLECVKHRFLTSIQTRNIT